MAPTVVRAGFVALAAAGGFGIVLYVAAWALMLWTGRGTGRGVPEEGLGPPDRVLATALVTVGLLLLVQGLGLGFDPSVSLPLVLVGLGLLVTWHRFGVETLITGREAAARSRWASFSPGSESPGRSRSRRPGRRPRRRPAHGRGRGRPRPRQPPRSRGSYATSLRSGASASARRNVRASLRTSTTRSSRRSRSSSAPAAIPSGPQRSLGGRSGSCGPGSTARTAIGVQALCGGARGRLRRGRAAPRHSRARGRRWWRAGRSRVVEAMGAVREAVVNAARHAETDRIDVYAERDPTVSACTCATPVEVSRPRRCRRTGRGYESRWSGGWSVLEARRRDVFSGEGTEVELRLQRARDASRGRGRRPRARARRCAYRAGGACGRHRRGGDVLEAIEVIARSGRTSFCWTFIFPAAEARPSSWARSTGRRDGLPRTVRVRRCRGRRRGDPVGCPVRDEGHLGRRARARDRARRGR